MRARFAFPAAFLLTLPAVVMASGCVGCSPDAYCDENGCYVCDAFGCRPADPSTDGVGGNTTTNVGGSGQGGATTTNVGGSGQGGGEPQCDPAVSVCPCGPANACEGDLSCIDGHCLAGCNFDFECGPGKVCGDGECVPGCDADSPGAVGYACVGGGCLPDPENPECTSPNDCAGLACVDGFCAAPCASNADCPTGELCDASSGTCFTDTSPTPLCGPSQQCPGLGQTCSADGYCQYACTTLPQCKLIDNRFEGCDMGVCKTGPELDPECTLTNPCPAGKSCVSNICVAN